MTIDSEAAFAQRWRCGTRCPGPAHDEPRQISLQRP